MGRTNLLCLWWTTDKMLCFYFYIFTFLYFILCVRKICIFEVLFTKLISLRTVQAMKYFNLLTYSFSLLNFFIDTYIKLIDRQ